MKKLLLAVGFSAFSMAAYAQAVEFAVADADGNGVITKEEAMAAMPSVSSDTLLAADADGDGVLNQAEYEALASQ